MSHPLLKQEIHWVDSEASLNSLCEKWRSCEMLAVDTEFMRSHTYYPIVGLLQVNDGEANYLIDPTVISDCSSFSDILLDEKLIKVLHSCSEDLEVFQSALGVVPRNIFDTQIAASMCGHGFSVGYARLVMMVLEQEVPKEETRSDWLQRPLSQSQIDYAAIDVEYLYQLATILIQKLKAEEKLGWLAEDCQKLLFNYKENQGVEFSYLRFKQAWRLSNSKLAVLKALATWREKKARKRDIPRNRVVKEHTLMEFAMMLPEHVGQLRKFDGMTERMIRSDGAEIIDIINQSLDGDPGDFPDTLPRPLSSTENKWAKHLRERVLQIAEAFDLAPEVLMKKRDYEALTRFFMPRENPALEDVLEQLKAFIKGWRYDLLAEPLSETIYSKTVAAEQAPPSTD
ncbi:ribonuclease D [Alteromonadaceae bacterium Bs31]|nr:ribonuclease D [Alteromonadaceae bacterium Bs31]